MIKSMTGFGRSEYHVNGREYIIELKTINHRYLDVNVRFPRQYSFLEDYTRKSVSKYISRGKIDVNIQLNTFGGGVKQVFFDEQLIKLYLEEAVGLEKRLGIKNDFSFSKVLQLPEVMKVEAGDDEDEIVNEFSIALSDAFEKLKVMRETEGKSLHVDLLKKCDNLLCFLAKIEDKSSGLVVEYKNKIENRVNELLKDVEVKLDESRLAEEVAVFADKASIDEEIVRFKSHVNQLKFTLELEEPVGKKLDFIVQEMNRETNTIGSKANNLEISRYVIEMKNEIEKIREQIQNIE